MEEALENARREGHNPSTWPKMLSDNGPGFIGQILADYLKARGIGHIFGAPYHPQTQGKVERLNRKIKEAMCLEISCSPDELQRKLREFMRAYNATPHSSIFNVSPKQMYAGRLKKILKRRAAIKRKTLNRRRSENLGGMASVSVSMCPRLAEPLHPQRARAALESCASRFVGDRVDLLSRTSI